MNLMTYWMIIRNSDKMSKKDKTLKEILDIILYENPSTQDEIAERLGITRRYVNQLLQPLVKDGTIKRAYTIDLKSYESIAQSLSDYSRPKNIKGNVIVNDMLENMARHVHSQLEASFNSVLEYDEQKAKKALEMDFATNNMVEKIRTSVETIVSMDYHSQFSKSLLYNEIAYDLERIGDYCGHIAKFVINDIYEIDEHIVVSAALLIAIHEPAYSSSQLYYISHLLRPPFRLALSYPTRQGHILAVGKASRRLYPHGTDRECSL